MIDTRDGEYALDKRHYQKYLPADLPPPPRRAVVVVTPSTWCTCRWCCDDAVHVAPRGAGTVVVMTPSTWHRCALEAAHTLWRLLHEASEAASTWPRGDEASPIALTSQGKKARGAVDRLRVRALLPPARKPLHS